MTTEDIINSSVNDPDEKAIPMFTHWWSAVEFSVSVSRPEIMHSAINMMRDDSAIGTVTGDKDLITIHKDTLETLLLTILERMNNS